MNFNNIGGDLGILGIPVAVVITLLVQLAKMLGMPSNWAPYSSLAIGVLASLGVQLTRPYVFDVSFVVYTLIIAVSYALMAMGVFSGLIGTQDHIRLSRPAQEGWVTGQVTPVTLVTSTTAVTPSPLEDSTMHVIGGGGSSPFPTNTGTK